MLELETVNMNTNLMCYILQTFQLLTTLMYSMRMKSILVIDFDI